MQYYILRQRFRTSKHIQINLACISYFNSFNIIYISVLKSAILLLSMLYGNCFYLYETFSCCIRSFNKLPLISTIDKTLIYLKVLFTKWNKQTRNNGKFKGF